MRIDDMYLIQYILPCADQSQQGTRAHSLLSIYKKSVHIKSGQRVRQKECRRRREGKQKSICGGVQNCIPPVNSASSVD